MQTLNPTVAPSARGSSSLSRTAILAYGIASYAVGVTGLVWLIAVSLGLVPLTGGPVAIHSLPTAIAFNLAFVVLFGVQHAIMARPAFKARWTRIVPAAIERPTFVLATGLIVSSMMWLWQPLGGATVWAVESQALTVAMRAVAVLGWAYLFAASFAINHFELFGLQQVWRNFRGASPKSPPFVQRLMYRFDRHPIMTGMLIGLWCTPVMSIGHLVLALGLTAYIVVGVSIEERTLVATHGEDYRAYRRSVPALVPFPGRR